MGTWTKTMTETFFKINFSKNYATYTNNSGSTEYIYEIKAKMGVASRGTVYHHSGGSVTGTGASISVTMSCGNSTASKTVSKTVGSNGSSGNQYPKYSDCEEYTFRFNTPIKVNAGSSVTIVAAANATSTVVVFHNTAPSGTVEASAAQIYIGGTSPGWRNATAWINIDGSATGWRRVVPWINIDGSAAGWRRC